MKNRTKWRANRRLKNKEEMLDKRNGCGVKDLTAYNAVAHMKFGDKAEVVLKLTWVPLFGHGWRYFYAQNQEGGHYGQNSNERAGDGGADGYQPAESV